MSDPIKTACFCPNTPHESDEFVLRDGDSLPIPAGIAASAALSTIGPANESEVVGVLIDAFLRFGAIASWNLVDDNGNPVPVNPSTVSDRLTWTKGGVELSQAAVERYINAKTMAPFGSRTSPRKTANSSRSGRTASSTSPKTRSSSTTTEPSE